MSYFIACPQKNYAIQIGLCTGCNCPLGVPVRVTASATTEPVQSAPTPLERQMAEALKRTKNKLQDVTAEAVCCNRPIGDEETGPMCCNSPDFTWPDHVVQELEIADKALAAFNNTYPVTEE